MGDESGLRGIELDHKVVASLERSYIYLRHMNRNTVLDRHVHTIGFGGSCHWCMEAVFQSLRGVTQVQQGWIASDGEAQDFSEAVLVDYDPSVISLSDLVAIHLHTHSCTSDHPMRHKYRSAIYYLSRSQQGQLPIILDSLQKDFDKRVITKILPFVSFKINKEEYINYFQKNKENAFCKRYIHPKLKTLLAQFSTYVVKDLEAEIES